MKTDRYLFIDGLRAFAMIFVMMDHSYDFYHRYLFPYATFSPAYAFFGKLAFEGVDIFYLISGFLITGVMINDYSENIDITRFYVRRFLKIVPLLFTVVVCSYFLARLFDIYREYNDSLYINSFFLLQTFMPSHPIFSQTGTLSIEMHFYIFYPMMACAIFALTKKPEERRAFLLKTVFLLIALVMAYRFWWESNNITHGVSEFLYYDSLLWGCALKILEPYYMDLKPILKRILAWACFVIAAVVLYYFSSVIDGSLRLTCPDEHLCMHAINILVFFSADFGFAPLKGLLTNRLIRWIGKISYAFYLWHYTLRYVFYKIQLAYPHGMFFNLSMYWAATIIIAAASTYTIERYFLNLKSSVSLKNTSKEFALQSS